MFSDFQFRTLVAPHSATYYCIYIWLVYSMNSVLSTRECVFFCSFFALAIILLSSSSQTSPSTSLLALVTVSDHALV